ncbi:hypothetical protein [uncultured Kiloniella sp.]|uniref:hypothetical protein n=1 Tax=uncultured Kiloniella sp. TaxID=1133091 RepID=UPI002615155A|nr:hypothetical protein [uncultured Kiloniella sp.]
MSDLFKQAFTVAGMIGFVFLTFLGTSIITGHFNSILLNQRKFWKNLCGERADGPVFILAVLSLGLIVMGYGIESPWLLGMGLSMTMFCYVKYRETTVVDPFDDQE